MIDSLQLRARNIERLGFLGANPEKNSAKTVEQFLQINIFSNRHAELNLHPALLQQIHPPLDNGLLELKRRNAVHQQSAWQHLRFENRDRVAELGQLIRAGHAARTGAYHRGTLTVRRRRRNLHRAAREGVFVDKFFDSPDANGLGRPIENAGAFAQSFLRTNPRADLRQVAGFARNRSRPQKIAFRRERDPFRNSIC